MAFPVSPEDDANLFSKLFFCWMTPLIKAGRHHPLQFSDLYPATKGSASGEQADKFERAYNHVASSSSSGDKWKPRWKGCNTLRALNAGVLGWNYWAVALYKPLWFGGAVGQVFALRALVERVTNVNDDSGGSNGGEGGGRVWVYVAVAFAMFIAAVGQGIAQSAVFHRSMKAGLRAQTAVAVAVYRKALRLSAESLGGGGAVQGQMGNLLLNDAQRLFEAVTYWHFLWLGIIEIIMLSALLFIEMRTSVLFCTALLLLLLVAQFLFAAIIARGRKKAMVYSDSRVQIMSKVLQDMRAVKLNAWEPHFRKVIEDKRKRELHYLLFASAGGALNQATFFGAPLFISLVMFAAHTLIFGNNLNPSSLFSSLAFVNVLGRELIMLPSGFRSAAEALISLARLDRFFDLSEIPKDINRMAKSSSYSGEERATSLDHIAKDGDGAHKLQALIADGDFAWSRPKLLGKTMPEQECEQEPEHANPAHSKKETNIASSTGQGQDRTVYLTQSQGEGLDSAWRKSTSRPNALALSGVNFQVRDGELISVVGQVGSGKTSLLLALLGELHLVRGSLQRFGTVAYCAQHAWIMNGTLKENITLFRTGDVQVDEDFYERIIDACCLRQDIAGLPAGDQTEIGERGVNLSGGQKARLALARSIYADADLYLFDDPLSNVDAIVAKRLKDQVFGQQGILASKARVVITHQLQLLPESNRVYIVASGSIVASGTYKQLVQDGYTFSNLVADDGGDSSRPSKEERDNRCCKQRGIHYEASQSQLSSENSDDHQTQKSSDREAPEADLTVQEDRRVGKVAWPVYKAYARAGGGLFAAIILVFAYTISQSVRLVAEWWLAEWSTDGQNRIDQGNNKEGNRFYVLIFTGLSFGFGFLLVVRASLFTSRVIAAARRLHNQLLDRIMRSTPTFFESNPTGRILNRFSRDVDQMDVFLPVSAQRFLNVLYIILGALVTVSWILPWFLIAIIPLAASFWVIQTWYVLSSRELRRLDGVSKSPIYSLYTETMAGLQTVRAFSAQKQFETSFQEKVDLNQRAFWMFACTGRWTAMRLDVLSACVVFTASIIVVSISDKLSPGLAGVALSQSLMMTGLFQWGVREKTECENFFTSVERICAMTAEAPVEAPDIVPNNRPGPSWPSQGVIEFDKVVLRYRPHLEPALRDLSFKTRKCERIGICGRTGAGKSSCLVALFRMVELSGGRILIDGINISEIGLRDLRTSLAIVPQDPILFNGTIRENSDPLGMHSDAKIWEALDLVHMRHAIECVDNSASSTRVGEGLDLVVSDGGSNFSSGERQLISLARVILSGARIVVLDEATSSIDGETDALIQQAVRKHLKNCTVLIIAHRLDTIADSDRILVMDDGIAVEFDTPKNLLERGGHFAKLVDEGETSEQVALKRKIIGFA